MAHLWLESKSHLPPWFDVSLLKWNYDKDENHEEESSAAATTAFALARPVEGRYDTETWNAQSSEGRSGCSHGFSSNHSYMLRVKVQGERMFEVWRTKNIIIYHMQYAVLGTSDIAPCRVTTLNVRIGGIGINVDDNKEKGNRRVQL